MIREAPKQVAHREETAGGKWMRGKKRDDGNPPQVHGLAIAGNLFGLGRRGKHPRPPGAPAASGPTCTGRTCMAGGPEGVGVPSMRLGS